MTYNYLYPAPKTTAVLSWEPNKLTAAMPSGAAAVGASVLLMAVMAIFSNIMARL
jgi:hypothetical protein